ncbi:hypothetical protein SBA2_510011 [Acidobacteriia bacterium SbA2]|nr:hypothetical protein SBA2_510011 [Acidobacteriia bacterium SbA2]
MAEPEGEEGMGAQSEDPGMEVIHPQAAGIDVRNSAHYVAVRSGDSSSLRSRAWWARS